MKKQNERGDDTRIYHGKSLQIKNHRPTSDSTIKKNN